MPGTIALQPRPAGSAAHAVDPSAAAAQSAAIPSFSSSPSAKISGP